MKLRPMRPSPPRPRCGRFCSLGLSCVALAGCAPDLRLRDDTVDASTAKVVTQPDGRAFVSRIDASDYDEWVLFSFSTGAEASGTRPDMPDIGGGAQALSLDAGGGATKGAAGDAGDEGWALAFRRFHVLSNGGVSGRGGICVAALSGAAFEEIDEAPEEGFVVDAPDSPQDEDELPDNAFLPPQGEAWYAYDDSDNTLRPNDITYVVRAPDGVFKMRFLSYYDAVGGSGHPSFRWEPLPGRP